LAQGIHRHQQSKALELERFEVGQGAPDGQRVESGVVLELEPLERRRQCAERLDHRKALELELLEDGQGGPGGERGELGVVLELELLEARRQCWLVQ
jgi:hypothetical protein